MAKIYYRSINAGTKTISDVPTLWLNNVKSLFRADVVNGKITAERYKEVIGEDFE